MYVNLGTEVSPNWKIDREYSNESFAEKRFNLIKEINSNVVLVKGKDMFHEINREKE